MSSTRVRTSNRVNGFLAAGTNDVAEQFSLPFFTNFERAADTIDKLYESERRAYNKPRFTIAEVSATRVPLLSRLTHGFVNNSSDNIMIMPVAVVGFITMVLALVNTVNTGLFTGPLQTFALLNTVVFAVIVIFGTKDRMEPKYTDISFRNS